jgi:addiction module RelE/StbE family toxin
VDLQFTEQALEDLVRLREFIAEKNPAAAQRISEDLIRSVDRLRDQPELGHALDTEPGVREWIAQNYVVHYLSLNDTLIVLQIWHGREDRTI